jgi:hypothetical protein
MTLDDLQRLVLALMNRVEQLERQLRSQPREMSGDAADIPPQPEAASPPPTLTPELEVAQNIDW